MIVFVLRRNKAGRVYSLLLHASYWNQLRPDALLICGSSCTCGSRASAILTKFWERITSTKSFSISPSHVSEYFCHSIIIINIFKKMFCGLIWLDEYHEIVRHETCSTKILTCLKLVITVQSIQSVSRAISAIRRGTLCGAKALLGSNLLNNFT